MCWHSTFSAAEIIRAGLTNPKSRLHPHLLPSRTGFYSRVCRGFLTVFFFPSATAIILGDFLTSYFPRSPIILLFTWSEQHKLASTAVSQTAIPRVVLSDPLVPPGPPSSTLPSRSPTPPQFSNPAAHAQSQRGRRLQGRETTRPCLSVRACLQPSAAASPVLRELTRRPDASDPLRPAQGSQGKVVWETLDYWIVLSTSPALTQHWGVWLEEK